jgi:hypothetical protein
MKMHLRILHQIMAGQSKEFTTRECHGFSNPRGSLSRVVTGTGAGWKFATLEKPTPVPRDEGFVVRLDLHK